MGKDLDRLFGQKRLHFLRGVNWRIVSMEEQFPREQIRPFCLESLQKFAKGNDDIIRVHGLAPGHVVRVDHPLAVEECHHHLLGPAGMDLCLHRAWSPFLRLLFRLAFCFRGAHRHRRLIHCDNLVEDVLTLEGDELDERLAGAHSGLLLIQAQQLGHPPGTDFFTKPKSL